MNHLKSAIPFLVSLVIAVSGGVFIYKWIQNQQKPVQVVKKEADIISIAAAAIDLQSGTKLTREMITETPFLRDSMPKGSFLNAEKLIDRVVISSLQQGEPIVEHRLAPENVTMGGVSAILSKGKRAVAVKGDKVIGISGFIMPGNRVDVLVTLTEPKTKLEKTKLVLENVPVLATGEQIENNSKGKQSPVDVYTLEVAPEDAEKLALAAAKGKLQFALRNSMDSDSILTKGATITQTLASLSPSGPVKKTEPGNKTKKWVPRDTSVKVEIIKGDKFSIKKVDG